MSALASAPDELTARPLERLGEGIGKVVYASEHWVVKRERSPLGMASLIVLWRSLKRVEPWIPKQWWQRMTARPTKRLRLMHLFTQAALAVIPRRLWYKAPVRNQWWTWVTRDRRGESLARRELDGSGLIPERIEFPPTRVRVKGWPLWFTVDEADERVDCTLYDRLEEAARRRDTRAIDLWLGRFLELRLRGWTYGLFSVDPHSKNFGVIGDRVVLLDPGGLTDRWDDVEKRLDLEDVVAQPHIQLGLGPVLGSFPEIAAGFDARWREVVNRDAVRRQWQAAGA
ncbi:MAG: hypothetical protein R2729_28890 [Bryobacteraceae bacterium]